MYPSALFASGNGPAPQVAVAAPPFTLTVRPSKFEQPHPFTVALVRRHIAPAVLKFPDWPVNVVGFAHGVFVLVVAVKVAVTERAAVIVVTHEPLPTQAPLQLVNVEPEAGVAVSVTLVPLVKLALHVEPHWMPDGFDATVPLPVPARATSSV